MADRSLQLTLSLWGLQLSELGIVLILLLWRLSTQINTLLLTCVERALLC